MYAVVDIKGHQYIIKKGDKIFVDKMQTNEKEIIVDKVLLLFDENQENVKIGNPYLEDVKVKFKVLNEIKGEKIHVIKFKRKNRYSRKIGFRPIFTILEVEEIYEGR